MQKNTKLSITSYSINNGYPDAPPKPIHYKAAAAHAVRLLREGTTYDWDGLPIFITVTIYHRDHEVGDNRRGLWLDGILGTPEYPAIKYVYQAMLNEQQRIIAEAQEWLTSDEIANEMDVQPNAVRQYIHRNREMLNNRGLLKSANERTTQMMRGKALNIWQTRRTEHYTDTNEYADIIDFASTSPQLRGWLNITEEAYHALKQDSHLRTLAAYGGYYLEIQYRMEARTLRRAAKVLSD